MKKSILVICLVLYSFSVISSVSGYCELCEGHVACNHTGNFDPSCPWDVHFVQFNRTDMLRFHNEKRNQIAGGFDKFQPAIRMNAVVSSMIIV